MKTIISFTVFMIALFTPDLCAQNEDHKYYIGGGAAFSRNVRHDHTSKLVETGFEISPGFGYLVRPSLMLGAGFGYSRVVNKFKRITTPPTGGYFHSSNFPDYEHESRIITPSVFIKYLIPLNDRIIFAPGLDLQYGSRQDKSNLTVVVLPGNQPLRAYYLPNQVLKASVSPEIQVFLTKRIGVQAKYNLFSFNKSWNARNPDNKSDIDFEFRLDPAAVNWGIFIYLGKRQADGNE